MGQCPAKILRAQSRTHLGKHGRLEQTVKEALDKEIKNGLHHVFERALKEELKEAGKNL